MNVARTVRLAFTARAVETDTHVNLSAVRTDGVHLWIAGDETATVERLTCDDPARPTAYRDHVSFPLADVIDLPGEADEEVDVEGISRNGPFLWVVGSHSAKRRKVKPHHSDAKAAKRLASVSAEPSRRVLARIALADDVPAGATPEGAPSAALGRGGLFDLLADDEHLAPFLSIPGKDNGLDVEGIAVHGEVGHERVYLGLRGPVLRGWAVVLLLEPREDDGELELRKLNGHRYAKIFLDLDGLGIRDMCVHGDDLLLLAGPSMDLDGPVRVYRWPGAANLDTADVVHRTELDRELDVSHGEGDDHAEGLALLPSGELLVVYDSPAAHRLKEPGAVLADVLPL
ncbi:DUF3616 domain-containing protein [Saccharopolyspora mangrovi]|uniref:DUF3616 domain-containing protein n=1 Tax=Saccharopolyspora mangrovi TaxID=3082379 RepID=A0ABU6AEV3_9PSEU|nr:DUF3616 domain-containing protein [Saccharopolyspora sp. S2-29]MEB3369929.1 DUF3616 domain-containing protein [Saccharopolyspora sp. S2-29]